MSDDNGTKNGELVKLPDRTEDGRPGPVAVPPGGAVALGPAPFARPAAQNFDVMRFVRSALRGRYALVIILGLIMGGLGAAAAWKLGRPQYASEGLVRISYSLPSPDSTDPTSPLPNFDMFMQSQKLLISSRRVIDMAMQDPVWKTTGRQLPVAPDQYFAEHMTVEVKLRSEYMRVVVKDEDPNRAATAVTAIINAYAELYDTQEKLLHRKRIGSLSEKRESLRSRVQALDAEIREKSKEYGTSDLGPFFENATAIVIRLEMALAEITQALAMASPKGGQDDVAADQPATGQPQQPAQQPQAAQLTVERIAIVDPLMRSYTEQRERLQRELRSMRGVLGENHPKWTKAQEELAALDAQINRYAEIFREVQGMRAQTAVDVRPGAGVAQGKTPEELRESQARMMELVRKANAEMAALGNKRQELQRLTEELAKAKEEEQRTAKTIETLGQVEAMGGRLTIVSTGEPALSPIRDPRYKLVAAGGMAGVCLPLGVVLLLSYVRRTYRYSDEAEADVLPAQVPFLGIIPELKEGSDDPELRTAAAHCIHQLRVSLLSRSAGGGPRAYLITSATAGEGKTTLTMSLALSCSAARFRTLVIDCDLVGRQLTEGLNARESDGLREALASGTIRKRVQLSPTGVYTLAAGRATTADACGIGADALRALLAEARQYFHVILIDTGPILGSVEAAIAAQEADGVILAVTRGQRPAVVEQAMKRLAGLNARISGVVFNRAKPSDFRRSPYGSSSYASVLDDTGPVSVEFGKHNYHESLSRFGGLVHAVAAGMPEVEN